MNELGHLMILASAGAGKTYALTTRFVRLLAVGAPPERIVALTFTRKAAGEFFDEILNRLASAAADPEAAARLAQEIDRPELGAADFLKFLRAVVSAMPRLNLGTLDGFFARMVQAFPLEIGLSGEFALLDEATARRERQRVLGLLFEAGAATVAAQTDFIEAFKRATYGVEEKALQRKLDGFLDDHGETYRQAPAARAWGRRERIWPHGNEWLDEVPSVATAAATLAAIWPWAQLEPKQRDRVEAFWAGLTEWVPGAALPKPVDYVLSNALKVWDALQAGAAEITLERKKVNLEPAVGRALVAVVRAVIAAEIGRKLEITQGIHAVLRLYERVYDEQVRRAGRLTFADVQRLLRPGGPGGLDEERRQLIDWRLDARFDHWLLDEFQDTSRGQWEILRSLVDEVVQDPEGRRSFFYVGDVKQAIYAWRGGDARLFREIFDYYNAAHPGTIGERHLAKSFRSGPAVIRLVNAVCGNAEALQSVLPTGVVQRWIQEWRDHASARPQLGGWAELRTAADEAARFAETLEILREVQPAERGLTVAVLVQRNDTGARLAEYLRATGGLAAIAESDLHVAFDNPLTCALLALLRAAAHPGDGMARGLVAMSPVGQVLRELGWADGDRWVVEVLTELHEVGFAGAVGRWLRRLEPKIAPDDAFSRLRGRQLGEAARAFDTAGGGSVAEFLAWAEAFTLRETESPGVVRVMTVHKAKGLGFDVVILPDLQGQSVDQRRRGLAVHRDGRGEVDWVLDLPAKALAEHDEVLREQIEVEQAESAYEALCKLYVALTRAKRALYVVIEPVGRSVSRNLPRLLTAALGESWSDGDRNWFEAISPAVEASGGEEEGTAGPKLEAGDLSRVRRLTARTPSESESVALPGAIWFSPRNEERAAWGTALHAELAAIEWLEKDEVAAWLAARPVVTAEGPLGDALQRCLTVPGLRRVWVRPAGAQGEVWRERRFEVVRGAEWITGTFDRVVIARDGAGRATRAWVYDFKTDGVADAGAAQRRAERYRPQLTLYREVVAQLTGLAAENVAAELVFTALAEGVSVR